MVVVHAVVPRWAIFVIQTPAVFKMRAFSYGGLGPERAKTLYFCFPTAIQGPLGNTTCYYNEINYIYCIIRIRYCAYVVLNYAHILSRLLKRSKVVCKSYLVAKFR